MTQTITFLPGPINMVRVENRYPSGVVIIKTAPPFMWAWDDEKGRLDLKPIERSHLDR